MSSHLVCASRAMCTISEDIEAVARSSAKVLITGENGVGKEVVARLIHERSARSGPLATINCAGVAESLLESELYGHVRGSFTGAHRDRRGWLDRAQDGTIFLDEVGEMSLRMQALLLRYVECGEIQRVGSDHTETSGDVRIIAATNRNLEERVAERQFREDLYFRLNVIRIEIPPLRERPEDIRPLLANFLRTFSGAHGMAPPVLDDQAVDALISYSWPGNVREVSNVAERLVLRSRSKVVSLADLTAAMATSGLGRPCLDSQRRRTADALYDQMVEAGDSFWTAVHRRFTSHDLTRDDLRVLVARGLAQTGGDYASLAALFNVPTHEQRRFRTFLTRHGCRPSDHSALPS
jgi:transcriptional regulator with GAF, ATPase, and Fis domain